MPYRQKLCGLRVLLWALSAPEDSECSQDVVVEIRMASIGSYI